MNIMDQRSYSKTFSSLTGLGIALLANTTGFAIGVGEVQVKSALNQPLYATIPITASASEQGYQDSLRVTLASPEMHQQAGLRYPQELAQTHFDLYQAVNGRTQVLVGTTQAIQEPLVTFLLEVEWSHGRLLKEISMLLDPPGYQHLPVSEPPSATMLAQIEIPEPAVVTQRTENQSKVIQPIATTALTAVADIGSFDVPVFVEVPAALKLAQLEPDSYAYSRPIKPQRRRQYTISSGQYGPVRTGDTLMEIAKAAARGTGTSAKQMARDIYEANPGAFTGSINRLEKGAMLFIPDGSSVATSSEARTTTTNDFQPVTGISTISDFAFQHPAEYISGSTQPAPAAKPTSTSTEERNQFPTADQLLAILPPDKTSTQIAQDIAKKLKENQAKADQKNVAKVDTTTASELPATNASLKSAAGSSAQENARLVVSDPSRTKSENEKSGSATTVESTIPSEQEALKVAVETESLPSVSDEDTNYVDTLLKWLPWLLLMVALPLMLLLGLRRKTEPLTKIPAPLPDGLDAKAPQRNTNAFAQDIEPTSEFRNPEDSSEFNADTSVFTQPDSRTKFNSLKPETVSSIDSDDGLHTDDLQPSASDTQETIRPTEDDDPATQVMEGFESADDDLDSELDAAQEAEIYLAYGQYSLAESAINRLRDSSQDNARYKLLQLKLFAETGNLDDMQTLAESLLKTSDDNSGLAQQIRKITDRAYARHDGTDDGVDLTSAGDTTAVSLIDDKQSNVVVPLKSSESVGSDSVNAETAQLSSAPFVEDIGDYLHEKPGKSSFESENDASMTDDPLRDSLTSIQPGNTEISEPLGEVEEAFTDAELDAISMELDLMDEPGDAFEISDDLSDSYADDAIENFSDTDYRLSPLGRDDTIGGKSERLEVPFDLESEIEKLAQENKPQK